MEKDEIISIDAGGQLFTILFSTLRKFPKSVLCLVFQDPVRPLMSKDGYYLDRDPEMFGHIIRYYRTGGFLPDEISPLLQMELDYWGINPNLPLESFPIPHEKDLYDYRNLTVHSFLPLFGKWRIDEPTGIETLAIFYRSSYDGNESTFTIHPSIDMLKRITYPVTHKGKAYVRNKLIYTFNHFIQPSIFVLLLQIDRLEIILEGDISTIIVLQKVLKQELREKLYLDSNTPTGLHGPYGMHYLKGRMNQERVEYNMPLQFADLVE